MDRSRLLDIIVATFNEPELRTLCFELDVDYDNLPGQTKDGKVRELIAYFGRRGKEMSLVRAVRRLRPNVFAEVERTLDESIYQTQEIPRLALPLSSRTGPLRQDVNRAMLQAIQTLNERVDDLGHLINKWMEVTQTNRTLAVIALVVSAFLIVGMIGLSIWVWGGG